MTTSPGPFAGALAAEHRRLDQLFGEFLAASFAGDADAARRSIERFDEALRKHTALEEDSVFPLPAGRKLVPAQEEPARERLFRELRLEHVQIREVSGMILRLLADNGDLAAARALAPNLARRWDAHTAREEREVFGKPESA